MLEEQNSQGSLMDSEDYIRPILESDFKQLESHLSTDRVTAKLTQIIQELPAEGMKVVSLIGGAASGKSTFAHSIKDKLAQGGVNADSIGTDDFVKGDRSWRWDNYEGKDGAEPRGKYDFSLLNEKIRAIKQNTDPTRTIAVPTYNQATGLAINAGEENYTHRIGKVDVLLVEGDFHAVEEPSLVVFMHVPDNQRLQNRINRDVVDRGGDPATTTASFNFRHKTQHLPHTLPAMEQADYVVEANTAGNEWQFSVYHKVKKPADL